jgi:tetratricopeptide (TPR) repeat protein
MNRKDRRAARKPGTATPGAGPGDQAQALFAAAVRQHQAGQLADAEQLYHAVLAVAPKHAQSLYLLGLVALQGGRAPAGIDWIGKALALNERMPEWHYNLAFAYQSIGRLDEAALHYRRASALDPSDPKAQTNLGNVLTAQGKLAEAAQCYRRVLALEGNTAQTCCNLGNVLARQECWAEAIEQYDQALAREPNAAGILTNSGIALAAVGRKQEALARHQRAVELAQDLVEARMNFAAALQEEGRLDEALAHYEAAIARRPDYAEAHNGLGLALMTKNDIQGAIRALEHAVALRPTSAPFRDSLVRALLAAGDAVSALTVLMRTLSNEETPDTKRLVVWCLTGLNEFPRTVELRDLVLRALSEPWGRVDDFAHVGADLATLNPALAAAVERAKATWPRRPDARELLGDSLSAIAADALIRCLLESCPISNADLEQFLIALRAVVLGWAEGTPPAPTEMPHVIELGASLAQQCFVNEYVYDLTEDEAQCVQRLHDSVATALASGATVPPLHVLAVAAYRPLRDLPGSERLLQQAFPDAVRRVLLQQIDEPRREAEAVASIPLLTPIEDSVSLEVRRQYEENPYPRWIKPAPASPPISFRAFLRSYVPLASTDGLDEDDGVDILIAGCGTGQHPIETARQFLRARVLAVDLSRASLGYAIRKTNELKLKQIEYAQADILKLGALDRSFDYIESFGVLHHLADPWQGWRALASLLRPGGVMNIALYSELARQDVVSARAFIAERGYGATAAEIRRFRRDVLALEPSHPVRAVTVRRDFFSTSNCRDLLFHVQEHRHTLPQIKSFLAENDLQFLGFTLDSRIKRLYAARFPDDPDLTDLDNWHRFEVENPKTFAGLYQIWAQKRR